MPKDETPEVSQPIGFDRVSDTVEAQPPVIQFSQQNNFSLNELPPLNQLDSCSDETRKFVMECYSKENDFRHKLIKESERRGAELDVLREKNSHKQKQLGAGAGTAITVATLAWSCYMVYLGQTLVGASPFIIALTGLVLAGAWGKRQKTKSADEPIVKGD